MNLETYLNNVKCAKKEEITSNFGIYDNWIIWLNEDETKVNDWISSNNHFRRKVSDLEKRDTVYGTTTHFDYIPGVVLVRVVGGQNKIDSFSEFISKCKETTFSYSKGIEHITDKISDSKILIFLHPYQENQAGVKKIWDQIKFIADVNDIICREFAFNQGVSLYLPKAKYE